MSLIEILEERRQAEQLSNRAFARKLGINHDIWAKARRGGIGSSSTLAAAAIRVYPDLREMALSYLTKSPAVNAVTV